MFGTDPYRLTFVILVLSVVILVAILLVVFGAFRKSSVIAEIIQFSDLKISETFCFYYDENDPEGRGDTLSKINNEGYEPEIFSKVAFNGAIAYKNNKMEAIVVLPREKVLRVIV